MPARNYDPRLTKAHLSNRFALSLVSYFADLYGVEIAEAIVEDAGLSLDYLHDTERWTSVEFDRRFCDAAARHLYDLREPPAYDHPLWQHWRDSAASMMRRQEMGPLWLLLWAMDGPGHFFADIEHMYSKGNRVTRMRLADDGPNRASVVAVMEGAVVDRPGACWSRRGFFEAVPTIWNLPAATVEHSECIHTDPSARHCRYEITFEERVTTDPGSELRRLRSYVQAVIPRLLEQIDANYLEHRQAVLTQRKVASYLPEHVLENIKINPEEEVILGGLDSEGAVLFADVAGFTRRCVEVGATEVVRQLNLYFEVMDEVIVRHGGIIDKRMGDGIMAVFVSPDGRRDVGSLAAQAVACGLEMLRALPRCNAAIRAGGGENLEIRVGVAAGPLVQGNIGSRSRLEHTVIGETVNLAARLQASATIGHLLTLPTCVGPAQGVASRRPRRISAKGVGEITTIELAPAFPRR
jgi:class 3 adenylate cyclase